MLLLVLVFYDIYKVGVNAKTPNTIGGESLGGWIRLKKNKKWRKDLTFKCVTLI